jgi:hypothetical protein
VTSETVIAKLTKAALAEALFRGVERRNAFIDTSQWWNLWSPLLYYAQSFKLCEAKSHHA